MLFNYYKVALRQLKSVYSLINIVGLTLGLSVFILIFLWVDHELSYDQFNEGNERIFRVVEKQRNPQGVHLDMALTPPLLSDHLKATFPEVHYSCRLVFIEVLLTEEEKAFTRKGLVADPSFFSVFTFPLVKGNLKTFSEGSDKIILTEKTAAIYFGNENALGKILKIAGRDLEVVGIVNPPANSHLSFDFIVPMELLKSLGWAVFDRWNWHGYHTYVKLKENKDPIAFEAKIKDVINNQVKDANTDLLLQLVTDIHLKSTHLNNDMLGHSDIQYVYVFSSAAFFLLLIACINYTNLATARSMKRAKETGVRKVAGAARGQLIFQFFSESVVNTLIALLLALVLSWLLLPYFNGLTGKTLSLSLMSGNTFYALLVVIFCCAFLTGIYPALFMSSLKPVLVLKGLLKSGRRSLYFRRTLVIVQFTLSIILIIGSMAVHYQLNYIRMRDIGYNKENILTFHIVRKLRLKYDEFKQEVKQLPEVTDVTVASSNLSLAEAYTDRVHWQGKAPNDQTKFYQLVVDNDFAKTFSIPMVDGRFFSDLIKMDSASYIVNETAAKILNIPTPVGSRVTVDDHPGTIIGIIKDFNFKSVHKKIEPIILTIDPSGFSEVAVRIKKGEVNASVKAVEKIFKKYCPERPFEFTFLDEDINKLYKSEQQMGKTFAYFSFLSAFISVLGLLAIVMYTSEQRRKEMSVRKVMGASAGRIFMIMSKESIALVVVANVIALPVAYYLMNRWLEKFAYHESLPLHYLLGVAIFSLVVPWLAISFFCLKSANANPVESLRSE